MRLRRRSGSDGAVRDNEHMADTMTSAQRSRCMRAITGKDTKPEMMVRRMVHALGFRYRLHVRALPGTPDIVLPRLRKIIDVRGCFWHMHTCGRASVPLSRGAYWLPKLTRNRDRDRVNLRKLRRGGWHVLVLWECDVQDNEWLSQRLVAFLRGP